MALLTRSHFVADTSQPLFEGTLGDLMRGNARAVPDRIALVEGVVDPGKRRRWTYRQLVDVSEKAARGLLEHFKPGDRVALLAPDTPEWVILQHAASFAGLIMVPINPAYTARELDYVLRNCEAAGILFAESSRGKDLRALVEEVAPSLPHLQTRISMSDLDALLASADPSRALPVVKPSDTIQIQYTSGTTGFPKGACLHHTGVINTSRNVVLRTGFPDGGVWINAMPMFHIAGDIVSEIGCFAMRGTFVLMVSFDAGLMLELFESEKCRASLIVPTMILAILDHPDRPKRDTSSFKTILTGAANVSPALIERATATFNCELFNMFGQTESNGPVCITAPEDSLGDLTQTVGRPMPHVEVRIVDPVSLEILPVEAVGEIWIRGYQVMAGYYGQKEENILSITEDGWLRSGDLGTMDARGYVKITGRLKDMIIRAGMNLYPKEIEDLLFEHPQVSQIAVVGLQDEKWGEIVAAVILPEKPDAPPSIDALYAYSRKVLSPQKTPERWFFVRQYPLTATGKIQKNILVEWIDAGKIVPENWTKPTRV